MTKQISDGKAASGKIELSKQDGKWLASDPASLQAVLAELEAANSWSQGQEALVRVFTALLDE